MFKLFFNKKINMFKDRVRLKLLIARKALNHFKNMNLKNHIVNS